MAVWFYVKAGEASKKTRSEEVAVVRLAITSPLLAARLFALAESIRGDRQAEVRIDVSEAAPSVWWFGENTMRPILVIDHQSRCHIQGRLGKDLFDTVETVDAPVSEVIAFAHRDCDHYCMGSEGVPAALFARAVQAAKAHEQGHIEGNEGATVVDVEIRDCGYGFCGCALMSDGSRAFHTGHLCATAEQAGREVTAMVNVASVALARPFA